MATIASVDCGGMGLPETDGRKLQRSIGFDASGGITIKKFRDPDKTFQFTLRGKSTTVKNNLATALLAAQTTTVAITPDSHIDLGNGAGTLVNAYWLGPDLDQWVKDAHDAWTIPLVFKYSS
jgi:hypothetical protein